MNEKEAIERATADCFVALYNSMQGTDYAPEEYSIPDVRCVNSGKEVLNLEITLTEDRPGDIKAMLGRSEDHSMAAIKAHVEKVDAGLADPLERVSSLDTNVSSICIQRIRAKMDKRYGQNTALVVRDISGVDWDWDLVVDDIRQGLQGIQNPYNKGIWIVSLSKKRIFCVA
jgi:hypothetical protein